MRRLLLSLLAGLAVFAVTAAAATFEVSPTVLQTLTFETDVDLPEPPEEQETEGRDDPGDDPAADPEDPEGHESREDPEGPASVAIDWDGKGEEHVDTGCAGEVDWRFVLTGQPGDVDATLEAEFDSAGTLSAQGEGQVDGHDGEVHFEVATPSGDTLASATTTVAGGEEDGLLTLRATTCHTEPSGGDRTDEEAADDCGGAAGGGTAQGDAAGGASDE